MDQWQNRWKRVIDQLEVIADDAAVQRLLDRLATPDTGTVLGFVNAHAMNLVVRDGGYSQALSAADVLLRDGAGMAILYRRLGLEPGLNMNGTDFIPRLMAGARSPSGAPGNPTWTRPCGAVKPSLASCRCRFTMVSPALKPICSWPASSNPS